MSAIKQSFLFVASLAIMAFASASLHADEVDTQKGGGGQGVLEQPAVVPDGAGGGFVEPRNPRGLRPHWYLGVFGEYTPTGMVLTQVVPGTPAARAGLEPGDRIVTVNGHQIGVVNGDRVPIDVALQIYARSGIVRLLVQDRRTKQLVNVQTQLVRGQVHF